MAAHLIPVFTGQLLHHTQLCNARDLHASLKVGRDFSTWITGRVAEYGFVQGEDFVTAEVLSSPKRGSSKARKQTMIDYHLTLDMAKELAMVENNEIGRMVRRYFIRVETELRNELRAMASHMLPIPGVKKRARDGLRLKETLILREQSCKTLEYLLAAGHPAQRQNLWYQLRQVNDALGIPTAPLAEIAAAPVGLPIGEG